MKSVYILGLLVIGATAFWLSHPATQPIKSSVEISLEALQLQSKLIVLSNKFTSTATSTRTHYGFTGESTEVKTVEAEYILDLSKIKASDFKDDGKTLSVKLPKVSYRFINPVIKMYDNGSWLFTFTNDKVEMDEINRKMVEDQMNI